MVPGDRGCVIGEASGELNRLWLSRLGDFSFTSPGSANLRSLQGAESMVSAGKSSGKGMEAINTNAAGIDIGSERHYVAISPNKSDSPVRSFACVNSKPILIKKGIGSKIYDYDNNEYIDYVQGLPVRSVIVCRDKLNKPSLLLKSLFYQETIKRGILFGPGAILLSYSHSKSDIYKTLRVCESSLKILKNAIENNTVETTLKGNPMKTVMTF